MFCPYCKKEIEDDSLFCSFCGSKIEITTERDKIFSEKHPNYDEQTSTEFASCQSCGASIAEKSVEEPVTVLDAPETPKAKKQLPKKEVMFGAIGAAVIAVLIIAISLFSGIGKSKDNVVFYVKDQEIFFSDLKKDSEAWQLTSRLFDDDNIDEEELIFSSSSSSYEDIAGVSYYLGACTYVSEDGKYIFFHDKIGDDDYYGLKLYYREVDKPEEEAIKIDSEVWDYTVNTSATLVTYIKGEEGNLYQYKIGEDSKDKIASGVIDYWVSDDGDKIGYLNTEGSLYLKYADKDKEKIASEVSSIEYLNDEITTAYYIKDDSLYKQVEGEDRVKIASDVYSVIEIYDSGEIYYLKSEPEEPLLMDKGTIEQPVYSLCYFNGTEETVITDTFDNSYNSYAIAANAAVIAYEAYDQSHLEYERYIAVKDTATVVEQQEYATDFTINADGTIVYYIDNIPDDKDYGELYRIDITNGVIGKPEFYDSDVLYCNYIYKNIEFVNGSRLLYFKDCKDVDRTDAAGEVYIDKVRVGTDVCIRSVVNYGDCDKVFYLTDWNDDKEYGTLKVYQGDKVTKIADDVCDYSVTNDGRALYLYDYSLSNHKGELREWNNGETRKIDDDVICIIPTIENRYRMGGLLSEPAAANSSRPASAEASPETPASSADKNLSVSMTQEQQTEWMLQIKALAYAAYDNMQGAGKATPEMLLANPYALRMYIYASTDYLFYDVWRKYDWEEEKRLTALEDAFGAGCIADDYEAYIPENAIKEKLRNMFGSAAVEGFNFAGIFDNGFFHYEEGDPGDYLALSECEKTNWNDMSQIIFSYEYGYIEEDPDETLGNIVISTQADTTSPYGCVVKQIEWKNIG